MLLTLGVTDPDGVGEGDALGRRQPQTTVCGEHSPPGVTFAVAFVAFTTIQPHCADAIAK